MGFSIEELRAKKVADLRELARSSDHESLQGYSAMRKEQLVETLANVLGARTDATRPAPTAQRSARKPSRKPSRKPAPSAGRRRGVRRIAAKGLDKTGIKGLIRELKQQRGSALAAGDREKLRMVRRQLHHLKRRSRAKAS